MRGLAFMLAASASFVVMNALTSRLGSTGVPFQTSAFARAAIGLLAALGFARARGASLAVADRRTMWTRSLAGSTSMLCTFYALSHLPLADATALLNTTPLWIALLAYLTLRESTNRAVLFALAAAGSGVVLIERPTIAAGSVAGLVALGAGVTSALAMVSLRRLGRETPEAVVVHFSWVATVVTGVMLVAEVLRQGGHPRIDAIGALELLGVGLGATVGQLFLTRAYALDRAARVGAAGWVQVVLALGVDLLTTKRTPRVSSLVGIALMVLAGVVLTIDARRDEQRQLNPSA